jgi:DNA-binding NtrC family response regulator
MSTVLLVDDEKNVLKTLSLSLKRYDFAVQQAQSGPDALKLLEESPCDIVVSDIRMTPMDGYKLASAIRKRYPEIPVIFMSAFGAEETSGLSEDLASFPRLTKPFPVADLVRLLQERKGKPFPKIPAVRILLFDEGKSGDRVSARLRSMGFQVDLTVPDPEADPVIEWNRYDLFALDERMLESGRWTLLNKIDHSAPRKPVLLISDRDPFQNFKTGKDVAVAVLHRDLLFREAGRARAIILSHLNP